MEYRSLGATDLNVSVIGLGAEHLVMSDRAVTVEAIRAALAAGVNYVDLLLGPSDTASATLGEAFADLPHRVIFAAHLGCDHQNNRYRRTRDVAECEDVFAGMLDALPNDSVDVLYACHNVDEPDDYRRIRDDGLFELAQRLQAQGKARYLGFSGHSASLARQAIETDDFDVLMFPVSFKTHGEPGRDDLLHACAARGVGVVGMKTFAGGALLTGENPLSPIPCVEYSLSRPGVATAAIGVKTADHVRAALAYVKASAAKRGFREILDGFTGAAYADGECVYCDHCLPCPVEIDIPAVLRLERSGRNGLTDQLRSQWERIDPAADACIRCGACEKRCPFGVRITERLADAVRRFGRRG